MSRTRRRPGAQPGNHNALKHGLYSKARVTRRTDNVPNRAAIMELDHNIALTRCTLRRLFAKDPDNIKLITYTMSLQERLLRTRRRFIDRDRLAKSRRSRISRLDFPSDTPSNNAAHCLGTDITAGLPTLSLAKGKMEKGLRPATRETNRAQAAPT